MINKSFYRTTYAVALTALFGCGGSDGGDSATSSLSVSQTKYSLKSTAYEEASVDIPFSVKHITGDQLYYSVVSESELLSNIDIYANGDNTGYARVQFKPGYEIGHGTKWATIRFNICHDYECKKHYSGSPQSVTVTNEVTLESKISRTNSSIEITADYHDVNVGKNITEVVQFSGTNPYQLYLETNASNEMVTSTTPFATPSDIGLNMTVETPSSVGVGTFRSAVTIKACYDIYCNYHIEGSPITVPVKYTVTGVTPTPDPDIDTGTPTSPPTNNTKIEFDIQPSHNAIDAVYSDALNVVAVVSDSPKNAIYFYNLSDLSSYEFNLSETPTSVAVDNLNDTNRFVIGHNMMITTLNYDSTSPQSSQTNRILNAHNIFDLATDGTYTWTIPNDNQLGTLQTINLNDGSTKLGNNWDYSSRSIVKVNPTGSALYSIATGSSSANASRAPLTDPANPSRPVDSRHYGNYSFCNNFWFNHSGTFIFTQCGARLNASDNSSEDMRYAGQITLPPTQDWPYYSAIETLDESHDSTRIAYAMQEHDSTIRILSSSDLSLQESFTIEDTTIDNIDYPTVPKFLFYGADGKLNIVGTATANTETHTLIFQH